VKYLQRGNLSDHQPVSTKQAVAKRPANYDELVRQYSTSPPANAEPKALKQHRLEVTQEIDDVIHESPQYEPAEDELQFIKQIRTDEQAGRIDTGVADQVEILQLQKLRGAELVASDADREYCRWRAKERNVTPRF
jgi:hypothetical protein